MVSDEKRDVVERVFYKLGRVNRWVTRPTLAAQVGRR